MSYYYRLLDEIPCRAPCRRYQSCGDVYEDSAPSCSCYNQSYPGRGSGCDCNQRRNTLNQCPNVFVTKDAISLRDIVVDNYENYKPAEDLQMAEKKMDDGCGCSEVRNYTIPPCNYNKSPTWTDQMAFRKTYQNNDPATGSVISNYNYN